MSSMLPTSKIVAPTKAEISPPQDDSPDQELVGLMRGMRTKNLLMTQMTCLMIQHQPLFPLSLQCSERRVIENKLTDPNVNTTATSYDTSQTGYLVTIRTAPANVVERDFVGLGVFITKSEPSWAATEGATASACRPLRFSRLRQTSGNECLCTVVVVVVVVDVSLVVILPVGCEHDDRWVAWWTPTRRKRMVGFR